MLRTTKNMREKYEKIQNYIFSLIPEKWEEIYLFASVPIKKEKRFHNISSHKAQRGELFFYYIPKGIIKRKAINVYEVPQRFNINEEQYLNIVEELYNCIKSLEEDFKNTDQELWTNLTISIDNLRFKIEYKYDKLPTDENKIFERNVIWKYKYLKIGGESKEERKILENYYTNMPPVKKETYETVLYLKTDKNTITFDKENTSKIEFVIYEKDDIVNVLNKTKNRLKNTVKTSKVKEDENNQSNDEDEHHSKNQILNG